MLNWLKCLVKKPQQPIQTVQSLTGPKVCIVDHGCKIPVVELQAYVAAQLIQYNQHFALPPPLGWGLSLKSIRVADGNNPPLSDEWQMGLFVNAEQPGALGFHDETSSGMPLMKIFPLLDKSQPWSVTASHEMLECGLDPLLRLGFQDNNGVWHAGECADAVEDTKYNVNGVWMSNWVTPAYFQPPSNLQGLKLDWMGLVKYPFEILPGGYDQIWTDRGWVQLTDNQSYSKVQAKLARGEHSRLARRQAKYRK